MRAATLAELAEHGFAGLTVEGVAARSGVHKTTVYRRWGTAAALAADALDITSAEPWPLPDGGSLHSDLRAIGRQVVAGFTDPEGGPVARSLTTAALHDPEAGRALHAYLATRHEQAAAVVDRAVARGEAPGRDRRRRRGALRGRALVLPAVRDRRDSGRSPRRPLRRRSRNGSPGRGLLPGGILTGRRTHPRRGRLRRADARPLAEAALDAASLSARLTRPSRCAATGATTPHAGRNGHQNVPESETRSRHDG
ncbi:TetR/AcrR family transcriptional regulator [Yinghuangia aomiensis]